MLLLNNNDFRRLIWTSFFKNIFQFENQISKGEKGFLVFFLYCYFKNLDQTSIDFIFAIEKRYVNISNS